MKQVRPFVLVADPEICPWGGDDSQNLRRSTVAIFYLTSFNRGRGAGSLDPLLCFSNGLPVHIWFAEVPV